MTEPVIKTLEEIRFVQAKNYKTVDRSKQISLIVLHTAEITEKPESAENLAAWASGKSAPMASWHYAVDSDSVVQCVKVENIAWHAPGANHNGIGIEMCGRASQTPEQWSDDYSERVLSNTAKLVALLCAKWNIPITLLAAQDLLAGKRGITTHDAVSKAFKKSTHTDPGKGFPFQKFLALVRQHSAG